MGIGARSDGSVTETDVLQVLRAISVKTISNYSSHLFHTEVDRAFAGRVWEA